MTNHMLPRMVCGCAILLVALAQCGCTSMNGWGMAGQPKPTAPANPNDKETISYLGAKKTQKKPPSAEELQSRIDRERAEGDRNRLFTEQLRLARQYLRDKRLDDAKKAYERALVVRPNDADCHHGLAVIADNQKQFDDADKHYEAALKQRKNDANLLSDYGYSQFLRGNDQQAEKTLNEALAIQPSHKGAMANLGLIYQKQGRPDEAMAMFRRGASDADAQKYMSQLFPQSRPPGGGFDDVALAQNSNSGDPRTAPPMPPEDIEYSAEQLKAMTPEQLKEVMNRKKEIAQRKRNEQSIAELQSQRRDFGDNAPPSQGLQSGFNQPGQQWVLGGNGNQNSTNSIPASQMPNMMPQQGRQFASNQGNNSNPNGYAQTPNGSLTAPPGTNPEMTFWQGAAVQNPPPGSIPPQGNPAMRPGTANGWNQQQQFGNDPSQANTPAQQFSSNGLQPGLGSDSNAQYASNAQYVASENSASAAAAQLGMNAGPGGLFPLVHSDGVAQTGFEAPNPAGANNSRMSYEFPSAPQFPNPNPQNSTIFGRAGRQGSAQNQNSTPIVQPSLTSDWGNFGPAAASSSAGTPQNSDGLPSINNGGANYRGSGSNWGDPANQPSGSIPYSGPWPANGSQTPPSNQFNNNGGGSNSPPMWNRGGSTNAPQPKLIGPATQNSSGNMPEDWPYAPARQ